MMAGGTRKGYCANTRLTRGVSEKAAQQAEIVLDGFIVAVVSEG